MTEPTWLRRQADAPFEASDAVAVAVVHNEHWHAGLVYADEDDKLHLLHLAFHFRLRRDREFGSYAFVVPELDLEVKQNIAAMCERVWKRYHREGLPYGFRFDATRFDASGEITWGNDEVGLTCATLPLAVFASVGRPLVDLTTWRTRDDDRAVHEALLALLREHCPNAKQHLAAVEKQVGCTRVRPEESAGACSADELPCTCELAAAAGDSIRVAIADS